MISRKVRYQGRVQGVGFRYNVNELAQKFHVTGYVRNLENGDVELVAQGDYHEVDIFLEKIGMVMGDYIQTMNIEEVPVSDRTGFEIRLA